jgi:acid phosphatase (class A)
MSMRFPRYIAVSLCVLAVVAARAAETELRYLSPNAVQPKLLLPAPPSVESDEYKAEIQEILAIQAARTDSQTRQFRSQEKLGLEAFGGVMPDWCTPDNLPKLDKLLKAASKEAGVPIDVAKNYFKRQRPFKEDNRIQPLSPRDDEFAYPSGHATRGILLARILAQLEPAKSTSLLERGRQIGWNRVIGGMHHPSDIAAGRVLGQAVARALLRNAEFQAELDEVKEEYEAAKKAHAAAAPAGAR